MNHGVNKNVLINIHLEPRMSNERQGNRQKERETGKQTEKERDRETDRARERRVKEITEELPSLKGFPGSSVTPHVSDTFPAHVLHPFDPLPYLCS